MIYSRLVLLLIGQSFQHRDIPQPKIEDKNTRKPLCVTMARVGFQPNRQTFGCQNAADTFLAITL